SNCLQRLPAGSITTWEDLTTSLLARFFPPGRTAKLRNNILMFQQHQGESLSKAWTHFNDLLQKCEIDRAAVGKICNKNPDESWEIIENLALYDHEGWNDAKEFMFGLLKELTTNRDPEKVLIREEAKSPVTKNVNSIALARGEEKRNDGNDVATGNDIEKPTGTETGMPVKEAEKENEAKNEIKNEPIKKARKKRNDQGTQLSTRRILSEA
ncbi:zinc finger, CCHC-type containing protein, partial [Tanacetum coccineum]